MSKVIVPLDFNWEIRIYNMYQGFKEEDDYLAMEVIRAMLKHQGLTVKGVEE